MQFKRFMSILMACVLLVSCLALVVACDNEDKPSETPSTTPTEAPTTPTETPSETPSEPPVDTKVDYTVTVKDTDGNPVSGVRVVICKDDTCFNPIVTNEEGVASMKLEEMDGYKGKVSKADGYTFSDEYTMFESGETSITIVITKNCAHENTETIAAVEPTCTEAGLTEGSKCADCGVILVEQTERAALGHTEETLAAVEPTCTETGLTEGSKCAVCGEILVEQTEVASLGHTEETIPATVSCSRDGLSEGKKCSVCDEILVAPVEVEKLPHTPGEEATCTTAQKCTVCFTVLVRKLGHRYDSPYDISCTACGGAERTFPTQVAAPYFDTFKVGYSSNVNYFANFTSGSFSGATISSVNKENGEIVFSSLFAGMSVSITGYAGYDSNISNFGYYIDNDYSNSHSSPAISATSEIKQAAGNKAKAFNIIVQTVGLTTGEHEITFYVEFTNGQYVDLTTWTVNVVGRDDSEDKPVANVIIIGGQSNAFGASPILNVDSQYKNKFYNNVYIHYNNINVLGGVWQTITSNSGFEAYKSGVGGGAYGYIGPELGIVEYLTANGYTDDAPLYIIKFTAAGTYLNGQWFPTTSNWDLDPEGLVADMGDYLYNQMTAYIYESLAVISKNYNPQIQSFFWVQGESDAVHMPDVAEAYAEYEQLLVGSLRADFADYAAEDGISFVNYAIQESAEGNPNGTFPYDYTKWTHAEIVNGCKKENASYWFDYNPLSSSKGELIINDTANIENSYLVIADELLTKGSAGEERDFAHLCGPDMFRLGLMMGEGMLFLESLSSN